MNRKKLVVPAVMALVCAMIFMPLSADAQKSPKGAKAIFDSGDDAAVGMSSSGPAPSTAMAPEKYVGISYKIALLKNSGDYSIVRRTRAFKTGERIKLLVRINKPGYLSIVNIGPTGNTTLLFNEYVEAKQIYDIPKGANSLRFAGSPGTEKVMIMLSGSPNPIVGGQSTSMAGRPGTVPPPPEATAVSLPPFLAGSANVAPPSMPPPPLGSVADAGSSLPPPLPVMIASSMQSSKDIVLEDQNKTGYAVISPKAGWKPSAKGTKDIVLESDMKDGSNYGVVPASAIDEGGILTLDFKLTHR